MVTSFLQAAMSAQGVQGLTTKPKSPSRWRSSATKLEGDVIAAR